MARSWCKVSAQLDSHPRIRKAGNLGRQVFEFALRRNAELDRGGLIPADHLDPEYLAEVLMLDDCPDMSGHAKAMSGLESCVRTGLLALDGPHYVICGWDDQWSKGPLTEAERKRNQRASTRNEPVEKNVRTLSGHDRDCPDSHALEEKRIDIEREPPKADSPGLAVLKAKADAAAAAPRVAQAELDAILAAPKPQRARGKRPQVAMPESWKPNQRAVEFARKHGLDLETQERRFRSYHAAKGSVFASWDAALDTWLDKAIEFSASQRAGPQAPPAATRRFASSTDTDEPDLRSFEPPERAEST